MGNSLELEKYKGLFFRREAYVLQTNFLHAAIRNHSVVSES